MFFVDNEVSPCDVRLRVVMKLNVNENNFWINLKLRITRSSINKPRLTHQSGIKPHENRQIEAIREEMCAPTAQAAATSYLLNLPVDGEGVSGKLKHNRIRLQMSNRALCLQQKPIQRGA